MKDILNTYPLSELREIVKLSNIKGYTKMKKSELIEEMIKPKHINNFKYLKGFDKNKRIKKPRLRKATVKKELQKEKRPFIKLTRFDLPDD